MLAVYKMREFGSSPTPEDPPIKFKLGHAAIDVLTFNEALQKILTAAPQQKARYVVTPNVDHILLLEKDLEFRRIYQESFLATCDGFPIIWASRLLGMPLPERITGSDLMPALCREAAKLNLSVAIIGGPPKSADLAAKNLKSKYPGLNVVWSHCPPIGFEKSPEANDLICKTLDSLQPNLVFVGLGAPKQEKWISTNRHRFRCGVLFGIGASIEFAAGTLKRAPKIFRKLGLEWAYRTFQDPWRLGKRYLGNFAFFWLVFKLYISGTAKSD